MSYDTRDNTATFIADHRQDKSPADGKDDLHYCLKACLAGKEIPDMAYTERNGRNDDRYYRLSLPSIALKRNPLKIISSTKPTRIIESYDITNSAP